MTLKLEIKKVEDGTVSTVIRNDWNWNQFWFEDGNASCDCNRAIFYNEGLDTEESEDCGDERFIVRCSDADTGEVLYDEFGRD